MDHFAGLNHKATSQALNDKLTKMANNHCKSQIVSLAAALVQALA